MIKQTKWMCSQQRLRSAWASTLSDQSSLCSQWVAKDPNFLHANSKDSESDWADAQADPSRRWAHMPLCWFCHEAAHFKTTAYGMKPDDYHKSLFEPCHEITVLFVLHKPILQIHMQPSNGARCLIFGQTLRLLPHFICVNSKGSGETAHPTVQMHKLPWAFAGHL